jgi:two-component system, NarL family, nitrate/nitrite response regulator NarL
MKGFWMQDKGQDVSKKKILLADDHKLVGEAVSSFLQGTGLFDVVVCGDLSETMHALANDHPDALLLDVKMPGMEGLQSISNILSENSNLKIIVFSGYIDSVLIERGVELGVMGFVPKTTSLKSLPSIVNLILAGESYLPHEHLLKSRKAVESHGLTAQEVYILRAISNGLSNKQIAIDLDRNESAIKLHMRKICHKLAAKNRSHAVILARNLSIIDA